MKRAFTLVESLVVITVIARDFDGLILIPRFGRTYALRIIDALISNYF